MKIHVVPPPTEVVDSKRRMVGVYVGIETLLSLEEEQRVDGIFPRNEERRKGMSVQM